MSSWNPSHRPAVPLPAPATAATSRWPALPPLTAGAVAVLLALYLTLAANLPLWRTLVQVGRAPSAYLPLMLGMGLWLVLGLTALLAWLAWPRVIKPLGLLLALVAAVVQHYMLGYHMVMDPSMAANVLQTDVHEAADLLGWRLLLDVGVVVLPVALWLWRQPIRPQPALRRLGSNALLGLGALLLVVLVTLLFSRQLAPLMRSEPQLRYMMNPLASLYSTGVAALRPGLSRSSSSPRVVISADAHLKAPVSATGRPPLMVLVVGETARADHFALNGYARDTTPELARLGVLSWRNAWSCGTSTLVSVPCMFSPLGRTGHEARRSEYENLLDVLQASGLAVLWLDNQSGCKGVCERVPNAQANDAAQVAKYPALCPEGECLDAVMLEGLDARLAALPPDRVARGVVLVMHQIGSHGPAYAKRASQAFRRFMPQCLRSTLSDCSHAELVNAYDNSIAYTDHFLAQTIGWLQQQSARFDTGLVYLSDHGESLGEYGLYLHGMPYALAPEVQKHVPLVAWFGGGLGRHSGIDEGCARAGLDAQVSHDNLFSTTLGLMGVGSSAYQVQRDLFAACRRSQVAQAAPEGSQAP
ncbi:phosphoethanolamine--lipid A transferase [Xenophilus arseniciresistens]|uniref:Phosphoethanolamine--lipid A transferase n=1 Tax=Xenophilus arseniciresistens TaxID=1283306 RepID=A0AAE3N5D1_9BURK|nr:phosphoethanolamine--lipid A transferase [Xenophilus arseniciresistens]MDA7414864.1 phosphoethanolamine--lipid A transferase [Xenophilus arseniciresistens]